jgi:hypothetical protein
MKHEMTLSTTHCACKPHPSFDDADTLDLTLTQRDNRIDLAFVVGCAVVVFTTVYLISDVIEAAQGNFTTVRLSLTYVGEAAIPFFTFGLYAVQRRGIGRLGLFGATAFAYSYVFFTGTVLYALVAKTPNYHELTRVFGAWMTVHGLIMVIGGLAFGLAVVRARELPRWTGACLMVGVVLVATASGLPTLMRTLAETIPATAFMGMGFSLLSRRSKLAVERVGESLRPTARPVTRSSPTSAAKRREPSRR